MLIFDPDITQNHLVYTSDSYMFYRSLNMNDGSHINSINLSSSIGSTTRIPIMFPNDYEVWALNFEDYVLGLEDNGYLIWEAITVQTFTHTGT